MCVGPESKLMAAPALRKKGKKMTETSKNLFSKSFFSSLLPYLTSLGRVGSILYTMQACFETLHNLKTTNQIINTTFTTP